MQHSVPPFLDYIRIYDLTCAHIYVDNVTVQWEPEHLHIPLAISDVRVRGGVILVLLVLGVNSYCYMWEGELILLLVGGGVKFYCYWHTMKNLID